MSGRVLSMVLPRCVPPLSLGLRGAPRLAQTTSQKHQLQVRGIHVSQVTSLKEIVVKEEGDGETVTVEAQYIPSPYTGRLIKFENDVEDKKLCPLCALNLDIKHTDVLILSQFVSPRGEVLHRRLTGLCGKQQRRITWLVIMAQKAGLMPNLAPDNSKRDPKRRYGSKKFNRYFNENTLPKL